MNAKSITIIGGGLAGLSLGIGLRQRGIAVTLHEAGHYPRHRVCGEFISGRGQQTLERLGLLALLPQRETRPAASAAFFLPEKAFPPRALAEPALCVSRFVLDAALAERFRQLGGELRESARAQAEPFAEGVVRASGRRLQPVENGWRWFGLKAHANGVELGADLEMHFSNNGYVGLCRLPHGTVNVCGLFRRDTQDVTSQQAAPEMGASGSPDATARLRGRPGSWLHRRLRGAEWVENSFCAVAGLPLRPRYAPDTDECCVGDALTMIAPVTGNGMSMAFESAELALEPLTAYARGEMDWPDTQRIMAQRCAEMFRRRLHWSARLQRVLFHSSARAMLLPLLTRSELLWNLVFRLTR